MRRMILQGKVSQQWPGDNVFASKIVLPIANAEHFTANRNRLISVLFLYSSVSNIVYVLIDVYFVDIKLIMFIN